MNSADVGGSGRASKVPTNEDLQEVAVSQVSGTGSDQRDVYRLEGLISETTLMLSPESLYRLQNSGRDDLLLR
jgi:hypothetical protein